MTDTLSPSVRTARRRRRRPAVRAQFASTSTRRRSGPGTGSTRVLILVADRLGLSDRLAACRRSSGEASAHYQMGYIRFAHFAAAQLFIVAFVYRIYRAFVGNEHARQLFYIPFWRPRYWYEAALRAGLVPVHRQEPEEIRRPQSARQSRDGRAVHAAEPLHDRDRRRALFARARASTRGGRRCSAGCSLIWPNSQEVHTLHHLGMWVMVIFILLHVYAAIREDIMSRQTMLSAIITGDRYFRDDDP